MSRAISIAEEACLRPSVDRLLNSLDVAGLPKHEIDLKPNMPIMLLRNLSPSDGLCNGTRLLVRRVINDRLLEAEIATGKHRGDVVFIPRIQLSPDEDIFPFQWSRRQFPVVAFAMVSPPFFLARAASPSSALFRAPFDSRAAQTINKAQGQTLERVGVYLPEPCFSHGQLYVAASRVSLPSHIRFAVDPDASGTHRTRNIVFVLRRSRPSATATARQRSSRASRHVGGMRMVGGRRPELLCVKLTRCCAF